MIVIYGNESCGYCLRAKRLAEQYSLPYVFKNTDEDATLNELKRSLPAPKATIPQIWWHDRYIGGYDDFAEEITNTMGGFGDSPF
jgi:glutaredoxin 1